MRVIGTAGHVDHGKSALIEALTGTHPDRLKEEQAREMTIELGFGWLTLPNGQEVGIVDVPGHRDFIENMLSGIGGIDAVLLVIAADEGIMPQTSEHLAILDLLQIPAGLIVLTKTDLAPDTAWLDLLESEIRTAVAGTVLRSAPILRVSAKNGTGLDALKLALAQILEDEPPRLDLSRPRLPIDRVFTMSGFGTVVTGTLIDGHISMGEEIELLPAGQKGRVRGLQTHRKKEERAFPGSRTAVNISGVETDSIRRGDVLVRPNQYQPTRRVDARFRLLSDASGPLRHGTEVKFFVGASESIATVRLLGTDQIDPGEEGWIQLELRELLVTVRGDRYILRRPSPGETLGGGAIVDHQPAGRHRRFDEDVLRSLAQLAQGSPSDILMEAALALDAATIKDVVTRSRLEPSAAGQALKELTGNGQLVLLEVGEVGPESDLLVMPAARWEILREQVVSTLDAYHQRFPLRRGIPREEFKSKLKSPGRLFNAIIKKLGEDALRDADGAVSRRGFEATFNAAEQAKIEALMRKFEQNPYSPPTTRESQAEVGEEALNALIAGGQLIAVSQEVVFQKATYDEVVERVRSTVEQQGQITLGELRDLLGTTRKYAQAILEHLDSINVTVRDGDVRKLRN